jgi:hypothetical protein
MHMDQSSFATASRSDRELERSMYLVAELVGMIKRCSPDRRQLADIGEQISDVAERLDYLIQDYEYTRVGITTQPELIKLESRPRCSDCMKRALQVTKESKPAETTVLGRPSWQSAFEFALACTGSVAGELIENCGTGTLESFPSCLVALRRALWRVQSLLSGTATTDTKTVVEEPSGSCADCGRPTEDEVGQK